MASKRPTAEKLRPAAHSAAAPRPATAQRTIRETVESIVVAFVLAFLFRTFEAEAFVIPTGSMAPTLQGRHKDVVCPECGFSYRIGASSEVDQAGRLIPGHEVVHGTCSNCRFQIGLDPNPNESFNGDRILVAKFPYDFADPRRWDVVVFHFPGEAQMNYIKRLVGRPHETVQIHYGDIFCKPNQDDRQKAGAEPVSQSDEGFEIARKPPAKVRAMAQTVYDNDYIVDAMTKAGWPLRWQPVPNSSASQGQTWQTTDGGRSYEIAAGDAENWIRYQHFIPFERDWEDLKAGREVGNPRPRLIADFYAYNSFVTYHGPREDEASSIGRHWVGDLLVEATLDVKSPQGIALVDLVRAGQHFRCEIDVQTGEAQLKSDSLPDFHPRGVTAIRGPGRHRIVFANFDQQLLLWVDGRVVEFDADTTYTPPGDDIPTADDLAPAGIGSRGAELHAEHILLKRDVYYIAVKATGPQSSSMTDYEGGVGDLIDFFAEPNRWTGESLFARRRKVRFELGADQFFVLGDNSPASKDSRLWADGKPEFYVARELLIGKALFIYWPHPLNRVPYLNIPFPYVPNFKDMGFVR